MFFLAVTVIGVVGFVLTPQLGFRLAGAMPPRRAQWLPWISAALFVVAWRLPNPALASTGTFTQHAVGGGAACAIAGLFIAVNAGMRSSILRIVFAYAVAASLGGGVEIAELAYDHLQGTNLSTDSSWDLLANTTGAVVTAVSAEAVRRAAGLRRTLRMPG